MSIISQFIGERRKGGGRRGEEGGGKMLLLVFIIHHSQCLAQSYITAFSFIIIS